MKLVNKQEREIRDNTQQQLELLRAILAELQAIRVVLEQKE